MTAINNSNHINCFITEQTLTTTEPQQPDSTDIFFDVVKRVQDFSEKNKIDLKLSEEENNCLREIHEQHSAPFFPSLPELVATSLTGDLRALKEMLPNCFDPKLSKVLMGLLNNSFAIPFGRCCLLLKYGLPLDAKKELTEIRKSLEQLSKNVNTILQRLGARADKPDVTQHVKNLLQRAELMKKLAEERSGYDCLFLKDAFAQNEEQIEPQDNKEKDSNHFLSPNQIIQETGTKGAFDALGTHGLAKYLIQELKRKMLPQSPGMFIETCLSMIDLHTTYFLSEPWVKKQIEPIFLGLNDQIKKLNPNKPEMQGVMKELEDGLNKTYSLYKILPLSIQKSILNRTGVFLQRMRDSLKAFFIDRERFAIWYVFKGVLAKYLSIPDNLESDEELKKPFMSFLKQVFENRNPNFRNAANNFLKKPDNYLDFRSFCFSSKISFSTTEFVNEFIKLNKRVTQILKNLAKTDPEKVQRLKDRYKILAFLYCNILLIVKHIDREKKEKSVEFAESNVFRMDFMSALEIDLSDESEELSSFQEEAKTPPLIEARPKVEPDEKLNLKEEPAKPKKKIKTRGPTAPVIGAAPQEIAAPEIAEREPMQFRSNKLWKIKNQLLEMGFWIESGARHDLINGEIALPRHNEIKTGTLHAIEVAVNALLDEV